MWTKVKYWLVTGFCRAVGILPTWFLYHGVVDLVYFTLYKVIGYRVQVVRKNLRESFPEKSEEELKRIEKGFYFHLSEVIIDTVDMSNISRAELAKRIEFCDIEQHEKKVEGKNWIAALAHYGSWEYFSAYQLHTKSQVVGVYRPLHDKAFDMYYNHTRSRFGLLPVPMKNVLRYTIENRNAERNFALGLIADQNAPPNERSIWFDFLNHKTLFFSGIEKLALRFGMPVYYMDVQKISRIRYKASFVEIYDGTEDVAEGEITERYVRNLEASIKNKPPFWMWSHRRWKYKYPQQEGVRPQRTLD